MKFLMDETGTVAVNTAFVKKIYLDIPDEKGTYIILDSGALEEIDPNEVSVCASVDDGCGTRILQRFHLNDRDKNLTAAKKYLVELIDKLNSGGNLVDIGENYE